LVQRLFIPIFKLLSLFATLFNGDRRAYGVRPNGVFETNRLGAAHDLVAIDARTGELVADNFDTAPARTRTTGLRESDVEKIRQCPHGIMTIHNHPSSKQPSFRDVVTAAENNEIRGSIVVGHDGSVWYVSVSNPSVADQLFAAYNDGKDYLGDIAETVALRRVLYKDHDNAIDWRRMR